MDKFGLELDSSPSTRGRAVPHVQVELVVPDGRARVTNTHGDGLSQPTARQAKDAAERELRKMCGHGLQGVGGVWACLIPEQVLLQAVRRYGDGTLGRLRGS